MKAKAESEGLEVNSPKAALKAAFTLKLIDNEEIWLEMIFYKLLKIIILRETKLVAICDYPLNSF